jgi:hypothetical protein
LIVGERQGHHCHGYRPLNRAVRFSLKARTPSSRSSVATVTL